MPEDRLLGNSFADLFFDMGHVNVTIFSPGHIACVPDPKKKGNSLGTRDPPPAFPFKPKGVVIENKERSNFVYPGGLPCRCRLPGGGKKAVIL